VITCCRAVLLVNEGGSRVGECGAFGVSGARLQMEGLAQMKRAAGGAGLVALQAAVLCGVG
jgi:hypothetical protein